MTAAASLGVTGMRKIVNEQRDKKKGRMGEWEGATRGSVRPSPLRPFALPPRVSPLRVLSSHHLIPPIRLDYWRLTYLPFTKHGSAEIRFECRLLCSARRLRKRQP